MRRPAALWPRDLCATQPDQGTRAQGLTEERLAHDERISDVLLAAADVCIGTSGVLDRHDAGQPGSCFATHSVVATRGADGCLPRRMRESSRARLMSHAALLLW